MFLPYLPPSDGFHAAHTGKNGQEYFIARTVQPTKRHDRFDVNAFLPLQDRFLCVGNYSLTCGPAKDVPPSIATDGHAYQDRLQILVDHGGQGLGRALITHAVDELERRGGVHVVTFKHERSAERLEDIFLGLGYQPFHGDAHDLYRVFGEQ